MFPISPPTEANLTSAAEKLLAGDIVAVPTETVYGLAGDATNPSAVAAIYSAKGRPSTNPLIVHVHSMDAARLWFDSSNWKAEVNEQLTAAAGLWPGPLTLVVPNPRGLAAAVTAGNHSVAIRMPSHPVFLDLLRRCGRPLAAPSANPSNYVSPTRAEHVAESNLQGLAMILDGGRCRVGLESTIVRLEFPVPTLLRRGAETVEHLREVFGEIAIDDGSGDENHSPLAAPGRMKKHYSPSKPLFIRGHSDATTATVDLEEFPATSLARISFQPLPEEERREFGWYRALSESGDLDDVARDLFDALREADRSSCRAILVDSCQRVGIGAAIMDRLQRASSR